MMNTLFNIRAANVSDAGAIATIGYSCWQDTYKGLVPDEFLAAINVQKQLEKAETTIKQGGNILVATNVMHYAVGYCAFGTSRDALLYPRENEIYSLYISKHARARGLGSILLFEAERRFAIAKPILVRTLRDNIPVRRFYEQNGYRYMPDRDGSFRNVAPDVAYVKYL